jgi:uncharacterized protein (TIGR02217 family)
MSFVETPSLPDSIALEAEGGPMFSTTVVQLRSGHTQANEEWAYPLHAYMISLENKEDAFVQDLFAFFYAVAKGRLNRFRMRDWAPGQSTSVNAQIGVGNGSATAFQLLKIYTIGSSTFSRIISKPVIGSVTCAFNGTPTTAFTVDTTTGIVTSAPGSGVVITASCTFDVPVQFMTDKMPLRSVQGPTAYTWPSIQLMETRDLT